MIKPVISYPGAKWRFWKYIKPYIPRDIKDWREPFFGGGSMSLSIADDPEFNLERMVVGDLAPEIWAMWYGFQNYPADVLEIVERWYTQHCPSRALLPTPTLNGDTCSQLFVRMYPNVNRDTVKSTHGPIEVPEADRAYIEKCISESTDEYITNPDFFRILCQCEDEAQEFWKWARFADPLQMTMPERAARMYMVNKFSFSALGDASDTMSRMQFFSFGIEKSRERIMDAQRLLKKMEIKNCSFEETMADVDKNNTFIFLDPPYFKQEDSGGLYGRGGETHRGFPHEHFAEFTLNTPCRWFITYDDSIRIRKLFKGAYIIPFKIPGGYTMAQTNAADTLMGEELFISNYDINSFDEVDNLEDLL